VFIERVRIRDYRNIAREELEPSKGINLIFGANAQGKTNFLDALHITAYLKSARATRDREIIRNDADSARVEVTLVRNDGLKNSLAVTMAGGKKFVKLDGNSIIRFEDAIGVLSAHFFFPGDLSLIKGDPALRREVLDYEVVKAVPSSIRIYADYKRALLQRNAILKTKGSSALNGNEFKAWTERMIVSGTEIVIMRSNLLDRIKPKFTAHYSAISQTPDNVDIHYLSTLNDAVSGKSRDVLRGVFTERLNQNCDKETELGYTTVGPHRDELLFTVDSESLRRYGSQGQQRSAVLAFKISLCDVARELSGEDPVLCLDDALSELDDSRKKQLLNTLKNRSQVFITLASKKELNLISILASVIYEVKNGKLSKIL
jgi:DNA replication and repair protein RecF